ncbi:hypothetical protein IGI04_004570 [Brassica rapa subsp. trilocularis]|uniref:Uncharacterized protein n=1 Tax=Brassica rapa subsp. trilocularis TaxID=1813537 RepID=A0ABQ7NDA5_BRACM|nr:hypothetical protein IGI04_004570 [Brassica rapa subsp. trilocularis]
MVKILDRYGKQHADDLKALDLQSKAPKYGSHHELLELVESKLVESNSDTELMLKLVDSLKEKEKLLKEENQGLASQVTKLHSSYMQKLTSTFTHTLILADITCTIDIILKVL